MGTRALTIVHDGDINAATIITMYRQSDGYPTGHGADLKTILAPISLVNGISDESAPIANGMGCLAAQLVQRLKDGPGQIYLKASVWPLDAWQDFNYHVYFVGDPLQPARDSRVSLRVCEAQSDGSDGDVLYDGLVTEFDPKSAEARIVG